MDDDPKGKKELVPLLPQSHEAYSMPRNNQAVKFIDNDERKAYSRLFKTLRSEEQKIIEIKVRRLWLFDQVHNEFVYLQKNPLPYGNKILTAFDLWQIPRKERLAFVKKVEEKNEYLRWCEAFSTFEVLEASKILPKNVKKGLSVKVIDDSCSNRCAFKYAPFILGACMFLLGLYFEISSLIEKDYSCKGQCPPLLLMVGGPIFGYFVKRGVESDVVKTASYSDTISDEENNDDNHMIIQITSDDD